MKLNRYLQFAFVLCASTALFAQAASPSPSQGHATMCPAADLAALKKQWTEWVKAYKSRDLERTMAIFDDDVRFSFQGSPDQNFSDLMRSYKSDFASPSTKTEWVPHFEEFECSGDLAFVRSTWALVETNSSGKAEETAHNRGIDIFRRASGGKWKIFRSLNYPLELKSK